MRRSKQDYRKIWIKHNGPIPVDEFGRSYEIHHIDGNHDNNQISNLTCVTIQEHYDIHYSQGDWSACLLMTERMAISSKEKSEIARKAAFKRVEKGNHHFVGPEHNRRLVERGTHPFLGSEIAIKRNKKRLAEGTHNWQKNENGESDSSRRVAKGTHHFVTDNPVNNILNDGRHASKIRMSCIRCRKTTTKNLFDRQHEKCWQEK